MIKVVWKGFGIKNKIKDIFGNLVGNSSEEFKAKQEMKWLTTMC